MIEKEEAIGNTAQEALVLLLAKSFDKFLKKQKVNKDFVDVLQKGRQIFQQELDIPFKNMENLSLQDRKKLLLSVIHQLITHYDLKNLSSEIEKEMLLVYKKWLTEFKIN